MNIGMMSFAHMHAYSYAKILANHPKVESLLIWDDNPERGRKAAETYGGTFYEHLDEFLQQDIEAVLVNSENSKHKQHVWAAAAAGKHVLCEKPLATNAQDAKEMVEFCQEQNVKLQVAFPIRYAPSVQEARKIIQSGQLGEIVGINATNHGKIPPGWFTDKSQSGGGSATDHIVHVMDIAFWVMDEEVSEVYAELDTRFSDLDVEDCGSVLLKFASGTVMSIDPSWSRPKSFPQWGDVKMDWIGTKGTLSIDVFKQSSAVFSEQSDPYYQLLSWGADTDEALINDFIHCLVEDHPPVIPGLAGLKTTQIVAAAYESARTSKMVKVK